MKKHAAIVAERHIVLTRRYICRAIFAILFLIFSGCATAPRQPVTIKHEKTSSRGDAAVPHQEERKEPADQSIAALAALLKSRNIISAEEAARLTGKSATQGAGEKERMEKTASNAIGEINKGLREQAMSEDKKASPGEIEKEGTGAAAPEWSERVRFGGDIRLRSKNDRLSKEPAAVVQTAEPVATEKEKKPSGSDAVASDQHHPKGPADQGIAALVDLLKNKNVISAEEASRLTAQSPSPVGGQGIAVSSEASEQERIEKITARAIEQVMTNIQDQVKKQVREELAKEMKEHEKERIEAITASVTEGIKKSLPEQVKGEVRGELPGKMTEKEQGEKITTSVTDELKKDVQEQVKSQVKEEVAKELKEAGLVGTVAEWIKRISIDGDLRLRYQGNFYADDNALLLNPSNPTQLLNTTEDQNRFKLRARLGLTARITDEVETRLRISTGTTSNPVSENITLGNYENNYGVVLDLAYLRWKPLPNLSLWGGRMPNPFFFTRDFVWWRDLAFDGISVNYTQDLGKRFAVFANGLASPVQAIASESWSKWLFGGQIGVKHEPWPDLTYRIAAAYYDYINISGKFNNPLGPANENDSTAPQFQQKGNTLININALFPPGTQPILTALAANFRLMDFTGDLEIGFWKPVYITLSGDYVRNVGFDRSKVALRTGVNNKENDGYQVGLSVGKKQFLKFGDWELFAYYKRLEADAALDAFTDPDFHAGGTNAKGWVLGGSLGLYKNIWLTARWMTADEISGPPLAIDTIQVDLNVRF
jgi:hypothetical protein